MAGHGICGCPESGDGAVDGQALEPMEVARIGAQIADALAAAHDAGIVHRDVKPGNVLLATDGTAKITDFGISRAVGDVTVTATGLMAGTPAYLAPEVARGEQPIPASDVFALGSTLYAAVEGRQLFGDGGNALAVLHTVARGEVDPPRRAGALGPVLLELLTVSPAERPTMRQAKAALEAVAAGRPRVLEATKTLPRPEPMTITAPPPAPATPREHRRGRVVLVGIGVAAVLIIGGVVAAFAASGGSPRPAITAAPTSTAAVVNSSVPQTSSNAPTGSSTSTPTETTTSSGTTSSETTPSQAGDAAAPAGAVTFDQTAAFIQSYYAQLPANMDSAWSQLSPDYQAQTGGYAAYSGFWSGFRSVQVGPITQSGPDTGVATSDLHPHRRFGGSEQRWIRVASEGGHLCITASGL